MIPAAKPITEPAMTVDPHPAHTDDPTARLALALMDEPDVDARALLDALAVAVYTTNARGGITYFNDAAVELWGRRPDLGEEWCGSLRLFHPDGTPMAHSECPMAIALKEGRAVRDLPAMLERPSGERVFFMPYPTPLVRDGRVIGGLNSLVDMTKQRAAEQRLQETADALATSNHVKDEFLGLVSHELRTPVTIVYGNAVMLKSRYDSLTDEDRRSMVDDIAADATRLRGTIENLLAMVADSGTALEREPQLLARVIDRSLVRFDDRHPERTVVLEMPDTDILVAADAGALELIVENLLSNAHKYSPPEERIDVRISRDADGATGTVAVLDRGIGLDAADTERIFEPFYRAQAARSAASGVGIGLSVVRRLMTSQGGTVEARPRPGGGSEFRLRLPLYAD